MKLKLWTAFSLCLIPLTLSAHCQLPCGVYHDDLVFDQIDQYIETMYKGVTVLTDTKFSTVGERNETIRWVLQKDHASDEAAHTIMTYFLQQKIKPGEADTEKKVISAHKLLFLLVKIKQNVDRNIVLEFSEEWDKFKGMFHREGYECEMEKIKMKKIEQQKAAQAQGSADDHDHEHGADHTH